MAFSSRFRFACAGPLVAALASAAAAEPRLFESSQVTPAGEYTKGIEGPAANADGTLYVVNFGRPGAIGKLVAGAAQSQKAFDLPEGSIGSAIRIDPKGTMFIADYKKHNILAVKTGGLSPDVYFHSDLMNQPNDITLARDGTIYASDPSFKGRKGQIWRIARSTDGSVQGAIMKASRPMGTTNGIDLSPDGTTLYVGESNTGEVWAYRLNGAELTAARLVRHSDRCRGTAADRADQERIDRRHCARWHAPARSHAAWRGADQPRLWWCRRQDGFRHPAPRRVRRGIPNRPGGPRTLSADAELLGAASG